MRPFIDLAQIEVKAGDGGDGLASFRHEKYVPKGGPDGGNGGKGGDVVFVASNKLSTLYDFKRKHKYEAENGERGGKSQQTGASGNDLVLELPVGTVVYEILDFGLDTARLSKFADLKEVGERVLISRGGRGGRGNTTFKSSTNQTPREFESGTEGELKYLGLEIKMIADVGLIGLPNAGKSTLLSVLTNANPEIADYPFTTLNPNLGVMDLFEGEIVIADIPGLIKGASAGKGLGDDFLRHVERTGVLVHLIDPMIQDPIEAYRVIRKELEDYSSRLLEKPEIVLISKTDVTEVKLTLSETEKAFERIGVKALPISAVTGNGLSEFRKALQEELSKTSAMGDNEGDLYDSGATTEQVFTFEDLRHY